MLGDTGPPIVLLHGLVGSGRYWGGAYDALATHRRVIVPDLLGFGRSPRPAAGYGPDDHAYAVRPCLDDLGIGEPVAIGAHSLGSLIALRFAATHPTPHRRPRGVRTTALSRPAGRWVCDHRTAVARLAVLTHPRLPAAIAADAVQHTWTPYSQTLQQVILAAEASTWLDDVRCRVHLVAGDGDRVVDHAHLRALAGRHDNIERRGQPGGHHLPLADAAQGISMIATASSGG